MVSDNGEFQKVVARIKDEAAESRLRWKHLHDFQQSLAQLQSIYALTVHKSQGSTLTNAFIDVTDILRNPDLEEQRKMLYVAVTRARDRLILIR